MFEVIEWDKESLFRLITKRISYSLPKTQNLPDEEKWETVFLNNIQGKGTYNYIIGRTLHRPRELIQFCIDSKERAVEIRSDKIDINAIVTSEVRYSEKRTKDIATEYKFQYPGLLSIFELFRGKKSLFSRSMLEELFTRVMLNEIPLKDCESWICNQSEEYLINVLYQVGFLKIYTTGYLNGTPTEGYFGNYEVKQSNISVIQKFMIHPMFRMYLGVVDNDSTDDPSQLSMSLKS